MLFKYYIIKRQIEDIVIYPFILIGRLIAFLKPLNKQYDTFFFFPFYHTGGAEKVHALLTQSAGGKNCIVFFTRKSVDKKFYNDFVRSGCTIKDISRFTDNKVFYFMNLIYRGVLTHYINSQKIAPIVFNGQCNIGYKISPWIRKGIAQVELIHSFNSFSWIRLPFIPFISQTIMISRVRIEDHFNQYNKIKVPEQFKNNIRYIVNGIPIPATVEPKNYTGKIRILYVGRGTEEKRVYLVARLAEKALEAKLPVEFVFMGDVENAIPPTLLTYCTLIGHKTEETEISDAYNKAHIVIITSTTEGFPLVIEEGMARNRAVIATPVGDIPVHVKNNENGVLFTTVDDEEKIIKEGIEFIALLCNKRDLLKEIGNRNRSYAENYFNIEVFKQQYLHLFNLLRNQ